MVLISSICFFSLCHAKPSCQGLQSTFSPTFFAGWGCPTLVSQEPNCAGYTHFFQSCFMWVSSQPAHYWTTLAHPHDVRQTLMPTLKRCLHPTLASDSWKCVSLGQFVQHFLVLITFTWLCLWFIFRRCLVMLVASLSFLVRLPYPICPTCCLVTLHRL